MQIRAYYVLTKPGIVYGNAISAAAGFFLASAGGPDFIRLALMLAGLSLVVASGCVWNNFIDRDIDAHMERTKGRAFVRGEISVPFALVYGSVLGVAGVLLLACVVNMLSAAVAALGFLVYIFAYSLWGKRTTPYGAHVGAVAGAVPPVVGYVAVSGRIDLAALILFLMLVFWQMPHFFAIAIRRREEYQAAGVPVLPLVRSQAQMRLLISGYILAFGVTSVLLWVAGYTGLWYLAAVLLLTFGWLVSATRSVDDEARWAKRVFLVSLVVLLGVSAAMSLNARSQPAPHSYPLSTD